jgi:hypothetical protein
MGDRPENQHVINHKPPLRKNGHARKAVVDDAQARAAYARAKAWADSPAGTPYGASVPVKVVKT